MGRLAGNWDGELAAPIADCWRHPINRRPITRGQLYGYIVIEEQSASKPARVISHKSIWMSCKVLNCFTFFRRWSCKLVHPEPHKSQRGCDNLHKICTNTLDSRVLGLYRIPDPIRGSAAAWTLPHSGVDWNFKRSIDNKVLGRDVFPFFILVDPITSPLPHFIDNLCRQFPLPHLYFFLLFLCLGLSTGFQQFFFGELKSSRTWKQVESITWLRLEDSQVQVLLTFTIPHCYSINYWSDLLMTSCFE